MPEVCTGQMDPRSSTDVSSARCMRLVVRTSDSRERWQGELTWDFSRCVATQPFQIPVLTSRTMRVTETATSSTHVS